MSWFHQFKNAVIYASATPSDLIGAGSLSASEALDHYRFQHQQKIRESVEATFPAVIRELGPEWDQTWREFWLLTPSSPRSLDFYPAVFLKALPELEHRPELVELARFELAMDEYAWSAVPVTACPIEGLTDSSILILSTHSILEFKAPVIDLYHGRPGNLTEGERFHVILWLTNQGVEFKALQDWEIAVLKSLSSGITPALESVNRSEEEVTDFFKWLAGSQLISRIT